MQVNFIAQHGNGLVYHKVDDSPTREDEFVPASKLPKNLTTKLDLPDDPGGIVVTVDRKASGGQGREISDLLVCTEGGELKVDGKEVQKKLKRDEIHITCERL